MATVKTGDKLISQAGATMVGIVKSSEKVSVVVSEISDATHVQAESVERINAVVAKLDHGVQQNAALVEQCAAAAESLKAQTSALNGAVREFQV